MPNKEKSSQAIKCQNGFEEHFYKVLFERFKKDLFVTAKTPLFKSDLISFPIIFFWFRWLKCKKPTVKQIIKEWEKKGWVDVIPFRGVRIREVEA